jgi:hypothetical protein
VSEQLSGNSGQVPNYVRITDRKIELTEEGLEALMSDYTPTTDKIREAWIEYKCMTECDECPKEFDRWVAEVKAEAWNEGVAAHRRYDYPENPYRGENK